MVAYSFKERFIWPIRVGLGITHRNERGNIVIPGPKPKRQTIRAIGKRRHARSGENVQLYYAQRTKQCFQIGTGKCVSSEPCELNFKKDRVTIRTEDGPIIHRDVDALDAFAQRDGFDGWLDLVAFWAHENPGLFIFDGQLIQWEPINGENT